MGLWDKILHAYSILIYLFLFGPIAVVILFSFNDYRYATFPLKGFTLKWFGVLTTSQFAKQIWTSLWLSIQIGVVTAIIVCLLGTLTAFALVRYRFRFRSTLNILVIFPIVMPSVLVGIAILTFYSIFGIPFSLWSIVMGHSIITLPFSVIMISASLWGFDRRLEEASADLGANELKTFWKITFPIVRNGIISGALIGFLLSFNEFIVAVFTTSKGVVTLPLYMWGMWYTQALPELNAITTTIIMFVAIIFLIFVVLFPKSIKFRL